jgi:hypothetical protein
MAPQRGFGLVLAVGLLCTAPALTRAQEATPFASPAPLGYPELRVRVTDAGIEAPAEVPAGRYLYTVENATTRPEQATLAAEPVPLPEGTTLAELEAGRHDPTFPQPWYYGSRWAGGPIPLQGQAASTIVDLTPGAWAILLAETGAPQPAVGLTVTAGPDPATLPEPTADAAAELRDFAFTLPERIAAGRHVWELTNTGRQVHMMVLLRYDGFLTREQVEGLMALPPEQGVDASKIAPVGGLGPLAPGVTAWGVYDLAPGSYLAICFVGDPETGLPHTALGMYDLVYVEAAAATPTA